ncbi:ferric reductase [Paenibacillus sp. LPE1-1-1.1]|uniref:ferric reductase n=1 Tax=Paenibacillus sp. LPE1-1-1.1 TaxID=3135230 RepID=UPI00341D8DCA
MTDWIIGLPTWQLTRILGICAYLLLFAGMAFGILYGYPFVKGKRKPSVYKTHMRLTNGGSLLALLHAAVLVIDTYTPFEWKEILVPFMAHEHPVLYGMGTLSLYGLILLLLTSDFRQKLSKGVWLTIHMLAYPIFMMAMAHGFFAGTDSQLPAIKWMYGATFAITLMLLGGRALIRKPVRRMAS